MPKTNCWSSNLCNKCESSLPHTLAIHMSSIFTTTSTSKVRMGGICAWPWSRYSRISARSRSASRAARLRPTSCALWPVRSPWACSTYTTNAKWCTQVWRLPLASCFTKVFVELKCAADLKLGNIMMVPPGDPAAFLALTIPKLEEAETTIVTGPGGAPIPRVHSRPLPYPLPDHYDMYSFDTWGGVEVKIGDVGVGKFKPQLSSRSESLMISHISLKLAGQTRPQTTSATSSRPHRCAPPRWRLERDGADPPMSGAWVVWCVGCRHK